MHKFFHKPFARWEKEAICHASCDFITLRMHAHNPNRHLKIPAITMALATQAHATTSTWVMRVFYLRMGCLLCPVNQLSISMDLPHKPLSISRGFIVLSYFNHSTELHVSLLIAMTIGVQLSLQSFIYQSSNETSPGPPYSQYLACSTT